METNNKDQNARRADDQDNQNLAHQQETASQDVSASSGESLWDNDQIGENSEQTPLAEAVNADESEKSTYGSKEGSGWNNNKPGATNEEKDSNQIPTSDPENYTS
ncbi:MAG TPA: hypothetical protein DIT07_14555 [Sphingobacteriaceae bacterium]|nr:hypothetical protein [Sphingobacteriaceae bacterium]